MNKQVGKPLSDSALHKIIDKWWDEIKSRIIMIETRYLQTHHGSAMAAVPLRTDRDILEEILQTVRNVERSIVSLQGFEHNLIHRISSIKSGDIGKVSQTDVVAEVNQRIKSIWPR